MSAVAYQAPSYQSSTHSQTLPAASSMPKVLAARRMSSHFRGADFGAGAVGASPRHLYADWITLSPRVEAALGAPGGLFPFGLRAESFAGPLAVFLGLEPGHTIDGVVHSVLPAPVAVVAYPGLRASACQKAGPVGLNADFHSVHPKLWHIHRGLRLLDIFARSVGFGGATTKERTLVDPKLVWEALLSDTNLIAGT